MHYKTTTLDTAHRTLHTAHITNYTTHYTLHTTHYSLHTPNFILQTPPSHCTLHTAHTTLRTAYTTHFQWYFIMRTPHTTLHTPHHTKNYELHTAHFTSRDLLQEQGLLTAPVVTGSLAAGNRWGNNQIDEIKDTIYISCAAIILIAQHPCLD